MNHDIAIPSSNEIPVCDNLKTICMLKVPDQVQIALYEPSGNFYRKHFQTAVASSDE